MLERTRSLSHLAAVAALLPLVALSQANADGLKSDAPTPPITKGLRVFTCGHSFHVWVIPILSEMAEAAGISGHGAVGASRIGGSRVIQHWDVEEEKNEAKAALRASKVDVLTLSPIWVVPQKGLPLGLPRKKGEKDSNTALIYWLPDEGIENFARLGFEHNPKLRVTVQLYWLPNDEYVPVYPLQVRKVPKVDHDATELAKLQKDQIRYDRDVDEYCRAINKRLGKNVIVTVPIGRAVVALRKKIVAGQVPSLKKQSELFRDPWGHPTQPVQALAAYCHFAMIYRRSPVGLPLPKILAIKPEWDEKLNRLLQELAWDAVTHHPMSGVRVRGS